MNTNIAVIVHKSVSTASATSYYSISFVISSVKLKYVAHYQLLLLISK